VPCYGTWHIENLDLSVEGIATFKIFSSWYVAWIFVIAQMMIVFDAYM
jgi:hypothetical protein